MGRKLEGGGVIIAARGAPTVGRIRVLLALQEECDDKSYYYAPTL